MATKCTIAPFINIGFYVTGAWGEQRATHKHAGVDLSTGKTSNVYKQIHKKISFIEESIAMKKQCDYNMLNRFLDFSIFLFLFDFI